MAKEYGKIPIEDMPSINQPYFSLRQAWIMKGCIGNWEYFRRYPYFQPKGGHYDDYVNGKGIFFNETILEWLKIVDKDLEAYNRKYQTGAKARSQMKKGRRLEATA